MMPRPILLLCILAYPLPGQPYDLATHESLSRAAAQASVLMDPVVRSRIGLKRSITDDRQKFIGSYGKFNVEKLIRNGARYEDDVPRSIHHFFDPTNGGALLLSAEEFRGADQSYLDLVNVNAVSSLDWALGTACSLDLGCNSYSLKSARDYFFKGLTTSPNTVDREGYLGLTFDSLGRIIHHLQDMAQPQHVRNDAHLHVDSIDVFCDVFRYAVDQCLTWNALVRPSLYERWTNRLSMLGIAFTTGYDPVYTPTGPGTDGLSAFGDSRLFWKNAGKGIAEFTSRNFLSENTRYRRPPVIDFRAGVDVDAVTLCATAAPPCEASVSPGDVVTFYSSVADDQFRPAQIPVPHAAAMSIFDPEFTQRNAGQPGYTLNRFTFADAQALLLPRAVAYSAGFINYFFRGDMTIEPPDEGVYAIVDHGANGCGTPCGFRKVKLKLTNVTPGIVNGVVTPGGESMGAGKIWAVVKYHLNNCYQSDLSGEYGAPRFAGNDCRSSDESIAVSQPLAVSAIGAPSDGPLAATFNFDDQHPIPINSSDVYLQVVFRGRLGQEEDAIAVTTVDISEPNFYALENMTDYVFDPALQQYFPLPYKNYVYPVNVTNVRVTFGSNGAQTSIATLDSLGAGQYAQFATLMARGRTVFSEEFNSENYYPYATLDHVPFDVEEFTTDDTGPYAGQYTRTCPVGSVRGMFRQYDAFFHMEVVNHRIGEIALKMNTVGSLNARPAGSAELMRAKAAVAPDCGAPQTTSFYNLSTMSSFTQANAVPWQISF